MNILILDEGSREGILVTGAGWEDHSGERVSLKLVWDLSTVGGYFQEELEPVGDPHWKSS